MSYAIDIRNLYVSYGSINVLEDVNLKVKERDFLAIIGPNGGGKTTLLKTILGLIKPTKGEIKIFGKSPAEGRKFIGYVPQNPLFDRSFPITVYETILTGIKPKILGGYDEKSLKIVHNIVKKLKIEELLEKPISELSGGQLQRVLIARALVKNPKILLLDEPTASIDPKTRKEFYEFLNEINKKITILLVTHDITAISIYIDKVACLNRKLFYHGSKKELEKLEEVYQCPIELIAHGLPHRVFREHEP